MASARYRGRMIVNDTDYTGSFVDPNPEGVATDDLNTVAIDGHIFNVVGSGGGGVGDITNYYGVFVDTNNIIQPFVHITDTSEHTYVATEDCAVAYYIPNDTNTDVYIKLDGIIVGGQYGQYINATSGIVYMKKGQVFSYQTTYTVSSGAGYTVYGLQSGDRIPVLIQDAQIYSEDERVVGIWTDGKPLYQKTVSFPANTSQTFSVNLDVQNVEHIFLVPDGCYGNDSTWTIPYITGNNYLNNIGGFFDNLGAGNTATFEFRVGQESAPYNRGGVLTFRYTKTTDEEGSGGYQAYGMSPVIYSTKEREIGVWTDNKPLYEKTVYYNTAMGYHSWTTIVDDSNITILDHEGTIYLNGSPYCDLDYHRGADPNEYVCSCTNNNGTVITVYQSFNGFTVTCRVTYRYTKTTDSPKRTGYELLDIQENQIIVDATRYSTEEKIIGTWIDNKPLYQKTFVISSIPSNSYDYYNFASNVDKVINYQGMVIDTSSDASMNICYVRPDNTNTQFYTQILADKRFFFRTYTSWTASAYITFYYTKTTDAAGSGGYQAYGFSPIIYSTEEREIGVWTDNKPLYQKTFILNQTVPNYQWTENILGTSGSGIEIKKYDGYLGINNEGYPTLPIDWCRSSTSYSTTNTSSNSDDLSIRPNIDGVSSVQVIYVTIQYTKTTDVAGSGEYNTLGVPNVHYDGNEKVVGTWFGETLYEKTMEIVNSTKGSVTIDLTGMNISRIVKKEGIWDRTNNQDTYWMDFGVYINSEIYSYLSDDIGHNRLYMARFARSNETLTKAYITIQYTKTSN